MIWCNFIQSIKILCTLRKHTIISGGSQGNWGTTASGGRFLRNLLLFFCLPARSIHFLLGLGVILACSSLITLRLLRSSQSLICRQFALLTLHNDFPNILRFSWVSQLPFEKFDSCFIDSGNEFFVYGCICFWEHPCLPYAVIKFSSYYS